MSNLNPISARRERRLAVLLVLISTLLSLAALELVFRMLPTSDSLRALAVNQSNPVLRFSPNRDVLISRGPGFTPRARKHVNNFGFLSEVDFVPLHTTPLLAVIGDSYVEASQVNDSKTFHGILRRQLADTARVYPFGVSGAALSSYLAYAQFARQNFAPTSLIVVVVGNDFDESWLRYKNAPGFHYFSRADDGINLHRVDYTPGMIRRVLRYSAVVRYLRLNLQLEPKIPQLFRINEAIAAPRYVGNTASVYDADRLAAGYGAIERFLAQISAASGVRKDRILIVLDGIRPQLYRNTNAAQGSYFGLMRKRFLSEAQKTGIETLDLQTVFSQEFARRDERFEFKNDAHWNAQGHAVVAAALLHTRVLQTMEVPLQEIR